MLDRAQAQRRPSYSDGAPATRQNAGGQRLRPQGRPPDARLVLHAAASARQPIAIFEVSERSLRTLPVLLTPLFVWLVTPFMRPFLWRRLFWTYVLPLVPLTCLWDGIVSQLRAYTPAELRAMCAGSDPMTWEVGQISIAKGRGRLTYLIGFPP